MVVGCEVVSAFVCLGWCAEGNIGSGGRAFTRVSYIVIGKAGGGGGCTDCFYVVCSRHAVVMVCIQACSRGNRACSFMHSAEEGTDSSRGTSFLPVRAVSWSDCTAWARKNKKTAFSSQHTYVTWHSFVVHGDEIKFLKSQKGQIYKFNIPFKRMRPVLPAQRFYCR